MIRIRPMVEEDLRLIRAWMNDDAGAPAWSEDDLAAVVKAPSPDQRRLRGAGSQSKPVPARRALRSQQR